MVRSTYWVASPGRSAAFSRCARHALVCGPAANGPGFPSLRYATYSAPSFPGATASASVSAATGTAYPSSSAKAGTSAAPMTLR